MPTPQTLFQLHLKSLGACYDAREWAGPRTAKQAWDECERADWLLWWAGKAGVSKQEVVKVACQIARTVLHLAKAPEALEAIEAAERWVADPTEKNRTLCRAAADDVAAAAAAAYAADAAYADDVADAAVAYAAAVVAYAAVAYAAADAAVAYAAYAAAHTQSRTNYCTIIRTTLPQPWTEPL